MKLTTRRRVGIWLVAVFIGVLTTLSPLAPVAARPLVRCGSLARADATTGSGVRHAMADRLLAQGTLDWERRSDEVVASPRRSQCHGLLRPPISSSTGLGRNAGSFRSMTNGWSCGSTPTAASLRPTWLLIRSPLGGRDSHVVQAQPRGEAASPTTPTACRGAHLIPDQSSIPRLELVWADAIDG